MESKKNGAKCNYRRFENYAATHRQNSRRESCNRLRSIKHDPSILSVLFRNMSSDQFNQSVITNESFRSDWIEIEHIQVKFFVWLTAVHCNFHAVKFVCGGCVVLKTPVSTTIVVRFSSHYYFERSLVLWWVIFF